MHKSHTKGLELLGCLKFSPYQNHPTPKKMDDSASQTPPAAPLLPSALFLDTLVVTSTGFQVARILKQTVSFFR